MALPLQLSISDNYDYLIGARGKGVDRMKHLLLATRVPYI